MNKLYNLTNPQKSIWLTEAYYKGSNINNVGGFVSINEIVDFDALKKALVLCVKNNDALNLHIKLVNGEPMQYLSSSEPVISFSELNNENDLNDLNSQIINTPFQLLDSNLYNITIFKFPNGFGGFNATLHHIISDAWNMSIFTNNVMNLYSSLIKNKEISIEQSPSYIDYIISEQTYLNKKMFLNDKTFWDNEYNNDYKLTPISENFSNSCSAKRLTYTLNNSNEIVSFCKKLNISPYSLFMAVLGLYLASINNSNNFIVGSPILNRTNHKEKNTLGMFVNTIPFKYDINFDSTFENYVKNVSMKEFGMLRHQKYPYNILLEDIRTKNNINKNLYDIALSYQNARNNSDENDISYTTSWIFNGCVANSLDIHIYDMDNTGVLSLYYDYNINIFEEIDIISMHKRMLNILNQCMNNTNILLKNISIITKDEKKFLLEDYNNTKVDNSIDIPIIRFFEQQVKLSPNKIAISDFNNELSYNDLNSIANNLAKNFTDNGLKVNDLICLFFNNSIELIATILACLKCGIAYIPIDTNTPIERVKYIYENSGAKMILSNGLNINKLNNNFSKNKLYEINYENLNKTNNFLNNNNNITSDTIAYIIYTSGSTGSPKGVRISNRSLTNYIKWGIKKYVGNETTNFPLYSSISFDLTVTSIYVPLASGNAIYIYNESNPIVLFKKIFSDKKTHIIKLTPAHLSLLLDCITLPTTITKLIVGGDLLSSELCRKIYTAFHSNVSIYNEYGPTEATVGCMIYKYDINDKYPSVPIGKPIENVNLYVLNKNMQLIPPEYCGELYIGGSCLSKGYLNLPEKNKAVFIKNPFNEKDVIYSSGDIVKIHYNGNMECIGRNDNQVKINGFRIEIGEIQSKLLSKPNINDCYITVLDMNNIKTICAYYVADKEIKNTELISFLSNFLPAYMIPNHFIKVDKLPLTINGKIDKKKLPLPENNIEKQILNIKKPQNQTEKIIYDAFINTLKNDNLSIDTNIFDYGIDSLSLIRIQLLLLEKGINISIQKFYEYPTIENLSNYLQKNIDSSNINSNIISDVEELKHPIPIKKSFKNVLLFGATGFLGIHILHELLTHTNLNIYCLIRQKDNHNPKERIKEKFSYYYCSESLDKYKDRIHIIEGNILIDNLGLSESIYNSLGENIDLVIDTAAMVKHYGDYNLFKSTNILGTEKIIRFCEKYNIPLHYISTISVCGYGLVKTPPNSIFSENMLYIGQDYKENVYVRSKLEAENLIINECKSNNLVASIYRIGNISNRYNDGLFQQNYSESAFLNRIIAFINLRCVPYELLNTPVEFTPVDICANYIVNLIFNQNYNLTIYHLFNNKTIQMNDIINIFNNCNLNIENVSIDVFKEKLLSTNNNYFGITGYINNLDSSFGKVTILNDKTNKILKSLNLEWPEIDSIYINKIIKYLKNNLLITGDENNEKK